MNIYYLDNASEAGTVAILEELGISVNPTSIKMKNDSNKQTNTNADPFLSGDW